MGFPRQEYWSGLLFPLPGDLPDPGSFPEPTLQRLLHWQADSLPLSHLGIPIMEYYSAMKGGSRSGISNTSLSGNLGIGFFSCKLCFPGGSAGKEFACSTGDLGSIPGLGRSPEEGNSYPLQYSGLENSMDCIVRGVVKSRTRISNFHFTSHP